METKNIDDTIIDGYLELLDKLNPTSKLDLISRLTTSIKSDIKDQKPAFKKSFGAFESKKKAEEIVHEIRSNRISKRQTEKF